MARKVLYLLLIACIFGTIIQMSFADSSESSSSSNSSDSSNSSASSEKEKKPVVEPVHNEDDHKSAEQPAHSKEDQKPAVEPAQNKNDHKSTEESAQSKDDKKSTEESSQSKDDKKSVEESAQSKDDHKSEEKSAQSKDDKKSAEEPAQSKDDRKPAVKPAPKKDDRKPAVKPASNKDDRKPAAKPEPNDDQKPQKPLTKKEEAENKTVVKKLEIVLPTIPIFSPVPGLKSNVEKAKDLVARRLNGENFVNAVANGIRLATHAAKPILALARLIGNIVLVFAEVASLSPMRLGLLVLQEGLKIGMSVMTASLPILISGTIVIGN